MQDAVATVLDRTAIEAARKSLAGMSVGEIARSHGSMFLLTLGQMRAVTGHRKAHRRGEWELLVEAADWTLTLPGGGRVTSDDTVTRIDEIFATLTDTSVGDFDISANGHLCVSLMSGHRLEVGGIAAGLEALSRVSRWTLFNDNNGWLACKRDGSLETNGSASQ
jgi:Family of unknown function (DUF6188)